MDDLLPALPALSFSVEAGFVYRIAASLDDSRTAAGADRYAAFVDRHIADINIPEMFRGDLEEIQQGRNGSGFVFHLEIGEIAREMERRFRA